MNKREKIEISIVDDDSFYSERLIRYLGNIIKTNQFEDYNFEFISYPTGEEFIENSNNKTDILILDYYLDSLNENAQNGLNILKQIKKFNEKTVIIILSSQKEIVTTAELLQNGASYYVVKNNNSFMRIGDLFQKAVIGRKGKQWWQRISMSASVLLLTTAILISMS